MLRRNVLIAGSAATLLPTVAKAAPWQPNLTEFDMVMGDPTAPVPIVEYASFTCPHCAAFHNDVMPDVKANLIDTGQANLVFRDFPLDGVALRAGMLARCLPTEAYFPFIDILFKQQPQWLRASDPVAELRKFGRLSGLTEEQMDACLVDEELANKIIALRTEGEQVYQVDSTPSFVINDTLRRGSISYDALTRFVDEAASA
ncbi:MAG: DsbA family protein [Pseudomonadota bacterium]